MYVPNMIYPVVIVCVVEKTYVLSIEHLQNSEEKLSIILKLFSTFFFIKENPPKKNCLGWGKVKHIIFKPRIIY